MDEANEFVELSAKIVLIMAGLLALPLLGMVHPLGRSVLVGQLALFGGRSFLAHGAVYLLMAVTGVLMLRAADTLRTGRRTGTRAATIACTLLLLVWVATTGVSIVRAIPNFVRGEALDITCIRLATMISVTAAIAFALWILVQGANTLRAVMDAVAQANR
ncbi:MAG: hypothetical protein QM770_21790 [Tepidisphaeraceae bacterium]